MGSFRTKVRNKGKRWLKGHSSVSNPEFRNFRNSARSNFFQDDSTSANQCSFTVASLKRHNELTNLSFKPGNGAESSASNNLANNADNCSSYNKSVRTFNTFASDWSCCSNVSFNKLFNRFDLTSTHHKEMLAALAAVTETIKANNGQESTVEYFAALMSALSGIKLEGENDTSVCAMISLLSMCIKGISPEILQVKFGDISKILIRCLKYYVDSDDNIILKSLLRCSAILLRSQDGVVWNDTSTFSMYDILLAFIVHTKSKIRKAGHQAVLSILKGSNFCKNEQSIHPAAAHTAKHCIRILEENISIGGITSVNHVLNLLQEIIDTFPKAQLKICCETVLKLMTLRNAVVTTLGFQTFYGLFSCRPNMTCCPATLNAQIITALYDYQPSLVDTQLTMAWLAAMQEAFSNLAANDLLLCVSNVSKFLDKCTVIFLSENIPLIDSATICMLAIIRDCIATAATEDKIEKYYQSIQFFFEILSGCLKYEYHAAWRHILSLFSKLYKVCGKTCHPFMIDCLKSLADLRDTDEFPYTNEIDIVFGCAIESIGPLIITKEIPLQVTTRENKHEVKRSWMLPLLKQHIKHSTLKCFVDLFLPIANVFRNRSEALGKANDKIGEVTYDLLQSQIWALLPSFCNDAQDIRETFPIIAKPLGSILSMRADLRSSVMSALRRLIITCMNNEKNVDVMSNFAKNYLPILFNIYTTECSGTDEEAIRVASLETIKAYLKIADAPLLEDLFNRALQKLESEETEKFDFKKKSILDITRMLIPYQDVKLLKCLFDKHISKVLKKSNSQNDKKYYRLLEGICSCRSVKCNEYVIKNFKTIKSLLLDTVSTASLPSRGARIRTAKALLHYDCSDETILEFVPEAVMCCKGCNKTCRFNAFELITHMAIVMKERRGEEGVGEYLDILSFGLVETTVMISASILALTTVVHCCKDIISKEKFDILLNNICTLAKSTTREIVEPALGFLKLVITTKNTNFLDGNLQLIIKTLSNIGADCKRKFRQKIRDLYDRLIRNYGAAAIIALVPTHDAVTITRLKALKKVIDRKNKKKNEIQELKKKQSNRGEISLFSRKQKSKTINEILAECDDDDTLNEEDVGKSKKRGENDFKGSKKWNVFLKETEDSIIDFTSSAITKNISTKYPSKQFNVAAEQVVKRKVEFPVTPDGRLIIMDEKKGEGLFPNAENNSDEGSIASDAEAESSLAQMLKKVGISRKRKINATNNGEELSKKYCAGGRGIHRKTNISANLSTGEIYQSKKAKGDVKRKGKPDPFAYIPLSRNALNRRKKKKSADQFKTIVRSARKGVTEGSKLKFKNVKRK